MRVILNLFIFVLFITISNASTNNNDIKIIEKDNLINSLNLETFDNFLISLESFEGIKNEYFKVPNENNVHKIKSQFIFNNRFNTLDLLLRFKAVTAKQPEYLFKIYQIALSKTKNLNYIKDDANLLSSDELLMSYFVEELINVLGLKEENFNRANLIGNSNDITTCMGDENCEEPTEAEKLFKLLPAATFLYGATLSDYAPIYAGTTRTYDSALATTWSGRQEYRNVNLDRDIFDYYHELYTDSTFGNPYDLLGVNDAYAYGLSGTGITINVTDNGLCADHTDMEGKTVTTFGTVTESSALNTHGCHVVTTAVGAYNNNSNSTNQFSGDYDLLDYSTMGVAYGSNLHFATASGDGTACSGDSDTDCWGPQHWELRMEDAIANGAKVSINSWSFDDDLSVARVAAWATENSKTNYESLVHFQTQKGLDSNRSGAVDDVNEIGLTSSDMDWTVAQWTEYVDALDNFQETGVYIATQSNDNSTAMSTVYGAASNMTATSGALPELFPELSEAWITVANTGVLADNSRILNSAPCGANAAYCVSHDGYDIMAGTYQSGETVYYESKNGTSMAAPQIGGAVALLFEAFPDNTPELITKRLLLTADNSWFDDNVCFQDTDSNGSVDSTDSFTNNCGGHIGVLEYNGINHAYSELYGHGNPDLYEALQPIGKKQLVDNRERVYPVVGSLLLTSLVFGDAMSLSGEQALYRDQLDGGFNFNLSSIVGTHQSRDTLNQRLFTNNNHIWSGTFNNQGLNFATSYQNDQDQDSLSDDHKFYMSFKSGRQSIFVGQKYSIEQMLGLQNGNTTSSILNRSTSNNSILSLTEASENGQVIGSEFDLNNRFSFTVVAYNGEHKTTDLNERGFLTNLKHKSNSNNISLFFGQNIESDSILRSSGAGAFGSFSGKTYHAGMSFDKKISNNVYIAGLFDYGVVTESTSDGLFLDDISNLETSQFNLGIVIPNVLSKNDFATLKISQPLRTERGTSRLNLPGLRDASRKISMTSKNINLEPSGRELNFDVGYEKILSSQSTFKLGTQLSFSPNHSNSNGNTNMLYSTYSINF